MVVNALAKYFNLSLGDWYPGQIPDPLNPVISIDGKGKNDEIVLGEAVAHTYNISEDDLKLRFSPADFEQQRGDYRIRREFPAFTIHLKGGSKKVQKMLTELGFKIVN
jgi:erythronate-4-phosphate dehydrogenase